MRWSTVWELFKINILYSNPQALTNIKNKQKKRPKKNFSAYKSVLNQQIMTMVLFLFIYIFMFVNINYKNYPGFFSFYVAIFFMLSLVSAFSAMYSVFYESNDVKLYVYLPIKPSELYLAKLLSSMGMGSIFLMPILPLMLIAYWQILGGPIAIFPALLNFIVMVVSSNALSLYINSLFGKIIMRSPHRKLISTILLLLSTMGAMGFVLYLNVINQSSLSSQGQLTDRALIPYFRGFYDVVHVPFSLVTLVNYWLPLILVAGLIIHIIKSVMPKYYEESLYQTISGSKKKVRTFKDQTITKVMVKHHLSTLGNASLLVQSFIMPITFFIIFLTPSLSNGLDFAALIPWQYFGVALLTGALIGTTCSLPTSLLAVGMSLEKDNFIYFKSLPLNFKQFLKQKFLVLYLVQIGVPLLIYLLVTLLLMHLNPLIVLFFLLGLALGTLIQGQFMYKRDYKNLVLNWQDITQLFSRSGGQWLSFGLMMGDFFLGAILIGLTVFLSLVTNALAVNLVLVILVVFAGLLLQVFLHKSFWAKLK